MLKGLDALASGEAREAVLDKFSDYLNARVHGELERHIDTGLAYSTAQVAHGPSQVLITLQKYRKYIPWSFKKGTPMNALDHGKKLIRAALDAAARGANIRAAVNSVGAKKLSDAAYDKRTREREG
jgi:hypothetical protein